MDADSSTKAQILDAVEEEYGLFPGYPFRMRDGWKLSLLYSRAPAGTGILASIFLSALGLWRYWRKPRRFADMADFDPRGLVVEALDPRLGNYAMHGAGLLGIMLAPQNRPLWLVFMLYGAEQWITIDGCRVTTYVIDPEDAAKRAEGGRKPLFPLSGLMGARIEDIAIDRERIAITFGKDGASHRLELFHDGRNLARQNDDGPMFKLAPGDDIADALIVSRRARLWLGGV
jgi:hypothetical protein